VKGEKQEGGNMPKRNAGTGEGRRGKGRRRGREVRRKGREGEG